MARKSSQRGDAREVAMVTGMVLGLCDRLELTGSVEDLREVVRKRLKALSQAGGQERLRLADEAVEAYVKARVAEAREEASPDPYAPASRGCACGGCDCGSRREW